jgi:hypothetical protein
MTPTTETTSTDAPAKKRAAAPINIAREAYSVAELAATGYFKKSRLYELLDAGELGHRLAGNKRVVPVEEWERFKRNLPSAPTGQYKPKRRVA